MITVSCFVDPYLFFLSSPRSRFVTAEESSSPAVQARSKQRAGLEEKVLNVMERLEDTVEKLQREDAGLKQQLAQVQGKLDSLSISQGSLGRSAASPGMAALLAKLGNSSNDLRPICKRAKPKAAPVNLAVQTKGQKRSSSARACPGKDLKLRNLAPLGPTRLVAQSPAEPAVVVLPSCTPFVSAA